MISEEAKVFFTTYDGGSVDVVDADGSSRKTIYAGERKLLGLAIDSKQR